MNPETTARFFTNFSGEDFSWKWNSELFKFKAGESKMLPTYLALHFAKHLVDRELIKDSDDTGFYDNPKKRNDFMKKCLTDKIISATSPDKLTVKIANKRNKKATSRIIKKDIKREVNKAKDEEEFAGLNKKK